MSEIYNVITLVESEINGTFVYSKVFQKEKDAKSYMNKIYDEWREEEGDNSFKCSKKDNSLECYYDECCDGLYVKIEKQEVIA